MSCIEFCTCDYVDCSFHPTKHNNECTPCIEKNLKRHEIPACFYKKIGEAVDEKSDYSFYKFAKMVIESEKE